MPTVARVTEQHTTAAGAGTAAEEQWTVAQAVQRSRVHWARVAVAVLLCVAMWHTSAIPVYRPPGTTNTTTAVAASGTGDVTLAVPEDTTPVAGTPAPPVYDDDDDDDNDEFEGIAVQEEHQEQEKTPKEPPKEPPKEESGVPHVSLLFVLLFSLFEPFPQLALLTLTRSGASCALAVVASLVQPEVAALYYAAVRGHAQHHPLLFATFVLVVAADTLFGSTYRALVVALRLVLPRARTKHD